MKETKEITRKKSNKNGENKSNKNSISLGDIRKIVKDLEQRALEHDAKSTQYLKEDCSFLAKEEYDKRDGIYEAIGIIKRGVKCNI